MKKLIALFLVLALFLPVLSLAEGADDDETAVESYDDDTETEDLDPDSFYIDENGNMVFKLGDVELSQEDLKKLADVEAEIELDSTVTVDPSSLCINPNLPDNVINILLIGVDVRGTKEIQKLREQIRLDESSTRTGTPPRTYTSRATTSKS